jgi:hypothetical protein
MRLRKKITYILVPLLIFVGAIELGSWYLTINYKFKVNDYPIYYPKRNLSEAEWRTETENWGAWHKLNSSARHKFPCFDVEYSSNEVGARDDSFENLPDKPNYILLGDSFAEGYGVAKNETFSDIIEERTGVNVLNFGSAGSFGPLQMDIIHEELAKNYKADGLIITVLPMNDFTDNDWESPNWFGQSVSKTKTLRWRPYYKLEDNGEYSFFFPENAIKRNSFAELNPYRYIEYFWFGNFVKSMLLKSKLEKHKVWTDAVEKLKYPDYPEGVKFWGYSANYLEEQKALVYFVDKIIESTEAKDIIIVAIPTLKDLIGIHEGTIINDGTPDDYMESYWWKSLNETSERLNKEVQFIDLAEFIPNNYFDENKFEELFHTCDGHWSSMGHEWAGNIISNKMKLRTK